MNRSPRTSLGRQRLSAAKAQLHRAMATARTGQTDRADKEARRALALFRSAMNWLEDTESFERSHRELDKAGRLVRQTFGCQLAFVDSAYAQECPVALAHNRLGMSPS